jgi:hypothetical protein
MKEPIMAKVQNIDIHQVFFNVFRNPWCNGFNRKNCTKWLKVRNKKDGMTTRSIKPKNTTANSI